MNDTPEVNLHAVLHISLKRELEKAMAIADGCVGWCLECQLPTDQVEHGTPPLYSDHHYVTTAEVPE